MKTKTDLHSLQDIFTKIEQGKPLNIGEKVYAYIIDNLKKNSKKEIKIVENSKKKLKSELLQKYDELYTQKNKISIFDLFRSPLFNTALAFSFVFIISISIYANIFFVIQETSRLDFSKNYENSTQIQKDTKGENDIQSAETPAVSEEYLEDKVLETNEKDSNGLQFGGTKINSTVQGATSVGGGISIKLINTVSNIFSDKSNTLLIIISLSGFMGLILFTIFFYKRRNGK